VYHTCSLAQRAGQEAGAHRTTIIDSLTFKSAVLWGWASRPTQRLTAFDTPPLSESLTEYGMNHAFRTDCDNIMRSLKIIRGSRDLSVAAGLVDSRLDSWVFPWPWPAHFRLA
jgi:hypothetical protein